MTSMRKPKDVGRREATRTILYAIGGAALFGCGSEASSSAPSSNPPSPSQDAGSAANEWASGGTKSMTAQAAYPDPFATPAATCLTMTASTLGPCTEAADLVRKDVSEGSIGLPVRLVLRIVDTACKPIANAKVKIWHTQVSGSYSGDTPNPATCLKGSDDATRHSFRGVQTTNDDGRVEFDTCFPGWYGGRTIHIHFTITVNDKSFTSQLVFDDALVDRIFTSYPEYEGYGLPDTHNTNDGVVRGGDLASFTLATARMSDGAMLASKQIAMAV